MQLNVIVNYSKEKSRFGRMCIAIKGDELAAASMGINLVSSTVVAGMFAILIYKLKLLQLRKPAAAGAADFDDDEEEI